MTFKLAFQRIEPRIVTYELTLSLIAGLAAGIATRYYAQAEIAAVILFIMIVYPLLIGLSVLLRLVAERGILLETGGIDPTEFPAQMNEANRDFSPEEFHMYP